MIVIKTFKRGFWPGLVGSKCRRTFLAVALLATNLVIPLTTAAAVDVTGDWTVTIFLNSTFNNTQTWRLVQQGTVLSGDGLGGGVTWTTTGQVIGNSIVVNSTYDQIVYSATSVGTISANGNSMSGTWSDSFDQSGTWSATRNTLTRKTKIANPPTATVTNRDVTFLLKKFSKALSSARTQKVGLLQASAGLKVQYTLTIKRGKKFSRKIISKRNVITARSLPPGTYTARYQASAVQGARALFSTNTSPSVRFTIAP